MKWLVRIGLFLVVLVLGAAFLLPGMIPKETLVEEAEKAATQSLGRAVTIGEISKVSILPPRLTLKDLAIESGAGFESPSLVEVETAELAVALLPLLPLPSSVVEIKTFILSEPNIVLETKTDGTNNFTFESSGADAGNNDGASSSAEKAAVVGNIVVRNGSIRWIAPDARYEATNANLSLTLPPVGQPLVLDGSLLVEGVPAKIDLDVAAPWAMTAAQSSGLSFDIDVGGNSVSGTFDALAEPLTIRGPMEIELDNVAALSALAGADLVEAVAPFGALKLTGQAEATSDQISLSGLDLTSAIASGSGDLALDIAGAKPSLSGQIDINEADLRPFFPASTSESTSAGEPFPEWSSDEMDFSGLKGADASVNLSANRIVLPTYSITDVAARAVLENGRVQVNLDDGKAFGGGAVGEFVLNARSNTPSISANMEFAGINFAEAAPALLSTKRLAGSGTLTFDINTQGTNEAAWVDGLTGTANAEIAEGSIGGVSLSTIAQTGIDLVQQLQDGGARLPAVQTALTDLVSGAVAADANTSFDVADFGLNIEDGEVSIGEAKLLSDTFRAILGGGVNLPEQGVDLSVRLSAKAPAESGYREFRLPVAVGGTFSEPRISLDTEPLARELLRGAASDALGLETDEGESLEDAVRERATSEFRNLLGGLTGRRQSDEEDDDSEEDPQE